MDLYLRRRDPRLGRAYDPSRVSIGRWPLFFTDALCAEHLDYLAAPILQGGKANTPQHCATVRQSLVWWRMQLGQLNLRALTVEELRARIPVADVRDQAGALLRKAPKGRKHKLAAFKHFVTWLRRVRGDGLNQGEGPDMSTLVLPQAHGHKLKLHDPKHALERQRKGQRALEGFPELRKALASQQRWAWAMHALDLQADTGWHTSEIQRWVSLGGLVEPMRLCVRLCEQKGIAKFGPSHMQHAFPTLNSGSGHSAKSIGAFLGHSEGQKGALVKSTYADPRSQIDGPAMEARPIPVRLQSPLEKLLEKPAPKRKRGSTATNMPPATA